MVLFWNFFTKFGGQVYYTTKRGIKGFFAKISFSAKLSKYILDGYV
jgi:hypothetical protein